LDNLRAFLSSTSENSEQIGLLLNSLHILHVRHVHRINHRTTINSEY